MCQYEDLIGMNEFCTLVWYLVYIIFWKISVALLVRLILVLDYSYSIQSYIQADQVVDTVLVPQ